LDAPEPTVTVEAGYSKRRRQDVLPLRCELAVDLRSFLGKSAPNAPAFHIPGRFHMGRVFRKDVEAAGIAYRDADGRVFDFHGLRHTFITNLARGGVHPKTAQQLARHSTITLTMDRYSHTVREELSDALDVLPDLTGPAREAVRATGTDGGHVPTTIRPDIPEGGRGQSKNEDQNEDGKRLAFCLARSDQFQKISVDSDGLNQAWEEDKTAHPKTTAFKGKTEDLPVKTSGKDE